MWHSTPIVSATTSSVTVGPSPPGGALAIRYLWYKNPCSLQPYKCPVYTDAHPLGGLTGERLGVLPLGPFVMKVN